MKIDQIFGAFKRLGQKIRNNVSHEFLTYLVFLLIATVIWYLNTLNREYTTDLKFAVRYSELPEDKVLANTPSEYLTLTINAQGFTLLKYRFGLIFYPVTLEASYQTLRKNNKSEQGEYYLVTQSAFDRVSAQLSSDVKLMRIEPDTVVFLLSETIRKEIAVKPLLQLQYEKGFLPRGNMLIEPGKVVVAGPKALVDTMQYVYTRSRVFRKLKDTLRVSIDLQTIRPLRYSTGAVKIEQAIERHTEAVITVPIEPINLPKDLTMKVFPGSVTVNCMVPVGDYEKLQPYMFRAVVDYVSVRDVMDNQAKARVSILRTPDFASDVKFHPRDVDFIIEQ